MEGREIFIAAFIAILKSSIPHSLSLSPPPRSRSWTLGKEKRKRKFSFFTRIRIIQRGVNCLPRVNYLVRSTTIPHRKNRSRLYCAWHGADWHPRGPLQPSALSTPHAAICPLTNGPDVRGLPVRWIYRFFGRDVGKKCRAKWLRDSERKRKIRRQIWRNFGERKFLKICLLQTRSERISFVQFWILRIFEYIDFNYPNFEIHFLESESSPKPALNNNRNPNRPNFLPA